MTTDTVDTKDLKRRMEGALENFHKELGGLRTGRASVSLLEPVVVDAYGSKMPLQQVGNVSVPEPRLLTVQVWDNSLVKAVDKAIRDSGLGLNPQTEGQTIRVPIPDLNEERRNELVKVAGKYAEQTRIAIRNIRRDGMDSLKRLEKDGDISQDERKGLSDDIQSLTDKYIAKVDEALSVKEGEITTV
jgi:ribosome recycling factor